MVLILQLLTDIFSKQRMQQIYFTQKNHKSSLIFYFTIDLR